MSRKLGGLSLALSMIDEKTKSIARRMFVTNAVDALLAVLGATIAQYIAGVRDVSIMISSALGISFVMGVFSGVIATLIVESAEQKAEIKHVEQVMATKLDSSVLYRGSLIASLYVALWSGLGMIVIPVIGISPLLLNMASIIKLIDEAVWMSICVIDLLLFGLGAWLGLLAKGRWYIWGLKFLAIGLIVTLIAVILTY